MTSSARILATCAKQLPISALRTNSSKSTVPDWSRSTALQIRLNSSSLTVLRRGGSACKFIVFYGHSNIPDFTTNYFTTTIKSAKSSQKHSKMHRVCSSPDNHHPRLWWQSSRGYMPHSTRRPRSSSKSTSPDLARPRETFDAYKCASSSELTELARRLSRSLTDLS